MNKEKLLGYEAPSTTIFVVKIQGILCQSQRMRIADWEDDEDPLSI